MSKSCTPAGLRCYRKLEGPLVDALGRCETEDLLLNRLAPALIAACDAVRSESCVAVAAIAVRDALLDAYQRTAILWGEQDYDHRDEYQYAVAAALFAAAATGPALLLDVVKGVAVQAKVLSESLTALLVTATYDAVARATLRDVWPSIMTTVLDSASAGANVLHDHHWGENALVALIPSPTAAITDDNPASSMVAAREGWPTPQELSAQIARWLAHAAGQRRAADNLIGGQVPGPSLPPPSRGYLPSPCRLLCGWLEHTLVALSQIGRCCCFLHSQPEPCS